MQTLREIIEKAKKINLDEYKRVLEKRPVIKQVEERGWFAAKAEVRKLPLDWQAYLSELIGGGSKSETDADGITAVFEVGGYKVELVVKTKNDNVEGVYYVLYGKSGCYIRQITAI